jgi:hypothetical protein
MRIPAARYAARSAALALSLLLGLLGCSKKSAVERPPSADDLTWECEGAACMQLAAERERAHDYLGAREALRAGCATGAGEACARVSRGPYLISDAERRAWGQRGCELGDLLSCEAACKTRAPWLDRLEALRESCPTPGADTYECQLLDEELTYAAPHIKERAACKRYYDQLEALYLPEGLQKVCAEDAPVAGCEAAFFQQPPGAYAFLFGEAVEQQRLCERGSAIACTQSLYTFCQRGESGVLQQDVRPKPCTVSQIAELETTPEGTRILTAAKKLCASGVEEACLALPDTKEESIVAMCQRGYAPACDLLLSSEQPQRGEPACLAGSVMACQTIAEVLEEEPDQQRDLVARACGSQLSSCRGLYWHVATLAAPRSALPTVDDAARGDCVAAVSNARAIAGLPSLPPGGAEVARALRACRDHVPEVQQVCFSRARSRDDLLACGEAKRSSEVLVQAAQELAREALRLTMRSHTLPAAWPPSPLPPLCCGGSCQAMPGSLLTEEGHYDIYYGEVRMEARYRWLQLKLARRGLNEVVVTARGRWECDKPVQSVEAKWHVVDGELGMNVDRAKQIVISRITTH